VYESAAGLAAGNASAKGPQNEKFNYVKFRLVNMAIVAERLRRLTRNQKSRHQLGSPRAGSSPADCGKLFVLHLMSS
jgi:hypothetical protein